MKNRILLVIISAVITLGLTLSLSSCNLFGGRLPDGGEGNLGGEGGSNISGTGSEGNNSGNLGGDLGGGDAGGDNNEGDIGAGDGEEDSKIEFIPGVSADAAEADKLTSAQRALLSTVIVRTNFEVYNGYTQRTETINGSGVIYSLDRASGDAIIVTNYHVVYYKESLSQNRVSEDIDIYLYGMEAEQYKVKATFVGGSLTEDIAVLRVSGSEALKNSCAVSAIIGDSSRLAVTDSVLAVGNPEGDGISATAGIVSMNDETITMIGADERTGISLRVIRVDCGVNQGNSGGGLYDGDGKLVGIVNAKKTGSEIDNIAWALPINRVRNLVDNILDHCDGEEIIHPKKALVGITLYAAALGVKIDGESGDIRRYEVVEVHEVSDTCIIPDEIAVGDRIIYTTVDGVRLDAERVHMVIDHLLTARVGSTLVIGAERDGVAFEITIILTEDNFVTIS